MACSRRAHSGSPGQGPASRNALLAGKQKGGRLLPAHRMAGGQVAENMSVWRSARVWPAIALQDRTQGQGRIISTRPPLLHCAATTPGTCPDKAKGLGQSIKAGPRQPSGGGRSHTSNESQPKHATALPLAPMHGIPVPHSSVTLHTCTRTETHRMCGSKPRSSMRSASSSTTYDTSSSLAQENRGGKGESDR
jgi:hypothetical protein